MIVIDTYRIDATLTEGHTYDSDVTEYPIESGSSVVDNVRLKPITVTLEGIVSDTPIGVIATARATASGDELEFLPSDEALSRLLAIRDARQPVTIQTSLTTFDNMVMTSLSIPRDAETGHALRFTAVFQQISVVTNLRTTIVLPKPTGLGNKPPVPLKGFNDNTAVRHGQLLTISGRDAAYNSAKGRWEYADKNGQPGGSPVPNSDVKALVQPTDTDNNPVFFDTGTSQWRHANGTPVSQTGSPSLPAADRLAGNINPWWSPNHGD